MNIIVITVVIKYQHPYKLVHTPINHRYIQINWSTQQSTINTPQLTVPHTNQPSIHPMTWSTHQSTIDTPAINWSTHQSSIDTSQ